MLGLITIELIGFYTVVLVLYSITFYFKVKDVKKALLLSSMTVFVAREYWEIPVFIAGYLGLMKHYLPMFFHHALVFLVFLVLVSYSKIKFTRRRICLLTLGLLILSIFLFSPSRSIYVIYLFRTIGITVFGGVFIDGASLVDA